MRSDQAKLLPKGERRTGRKIAPAHAMAKRMPGWLWMVVVAGLAASCPARAQTGSRMPIAVMAKSWGLGEPTPILVSVSRCSSISASSPNDDPVNTIVGLWKGICDAIHKDRMKNYRPSPPNPKPKPRYRLKLFLCLCGIGILLGFKNWAAEKWAKRKSRGAGGRP